MSNQHVKKAIQALIDNGAKQEDLPTEDEVLSSKDGTTWSKHGWSLVKNAENSYNVSF